MREPQLLGHPAGGLVARRQARQVPRGGAAWRLLDQAPTGCLLQPTCALCSRGDAAYLRALKDMMHGDL